MKNLHRFFIVLVLLGLLVPAWTPAMAAKGTAEKTVKLVVDNRLTRPIEITIEGPTTLTFYAMPGTVEKVVPKGNYDYSYEACGSKVTGYLRAKGTKAKIKIAPCKTSKIVIINRGNTTVNLQLYGGWENYTFTVLPQSVQRVTVVRGTYKYTSTWCGKSKQGTIMALLKSYRWIFWCG